MKQVGLLLMVAGLIVALGGCVPAVMVPTVAARPGPGKSPVDFSGDNTACAAQANQGVTAARNAANTQIVGAMLLTDPNTTSATAQTNIASVQQQFDTAYSACMYAKGEFVPGYGVVEDEPVPNSRSRAPSKPKSAPPSASTFVEPPPSAAAATPASSPGFAEPPPAQR